MWMKAFFFFIFLQVLAKKEMKKGEENREGILGIFMRALCDENKIDMKMKDEDECVGSWN